MRDASGTFATSLWVLVAMAAALLDSVALLSPGRLNAGGPVAMR